MGQDPQAGIPAAGDVIAGRYQVEDIIGAGGMGVVVAARHVALGQRVAIKFLFPEMAARPDVVARFMREARAGASIRSEHVARIFDVANLPNGAPYMVMELLVGDELEKAAAARGPLPIPEAVDYVLQACEAVADAHAQGIVHRDLKTANLFLAKRPDGSTTVKILDFGISKMVDAAVGLTSDSATLGSPGFISPEQLRSTKTADHRTDIWALGVVLHRLITDTMPFDGERIQDVLAKILHTPAPPLRSVRRDVPAELEAVVLRCLDKTLERRIQDVAELALALAPFAPAHSHASIALIWKSLRGNAPLPPLPPPIAAPMAHPGMAPASQPLPASGPVPMSAEMRAARRTVPMQAVASPPSPVSPQAPLPVVPSPVALAVGSTMPMSPDMPAPSATYGAQAAKAAPVAPKRRSVLPLVTLAVAVLVIVGGWLVSRLL